MNYHEQAYWNRQYRAGNFGEIYEWLDDFENLAPHFMGYFEKAIDMQIASKNKVTPVSVLHVGCGNSLLMDDVEKRLKQRIPRDSNSIQSEDPELLSQNLLHSINLDYSLPIISQMKKSHPHLHFVQGDVENLLKPFPSWKNSYDIVLEKGLTDALLSDLDEKSCQQRMANLANEILAVLKPGGIWIIFTLEALRIRQRMEVLGIPSWKLLEVREHDSSTDSENSVNASEKPNLIKSCAMLVYQKAPKDMGDVCKKCKKRGVFSNIKKSPTTAKCGNLKSTKSTSNIIMKVTQQACGRCGG